MYQDVTLSKRKHSIHHNFFDLILRTVPQTKVMTELNIQGKSNLHMIDIRTILIG